MVYLARVPHPATSWVAPPSRGSLPCDPCPTGGERQPADACSLNDDVINREKVIVAFEQKREKFARYTSRTPYAGVREKGKDDRRLKSLDEFYVRIEREAEGKGDVADRARALMHQLQAKGKWPAKSSLSKWLGAPGSRWQDRDTGAFIRAVTLPDDSELITRHEVHAAPPDLLVTNYSMLEYMLMRPIERSIFDELVAMSVPATVPVGRRARAWNAAMDRVSRLL